ncbi:hypothetical protein [Aliiroseovarius sp. xm-v-204]|uniref:hypothetical protein n=1 Tax=unclassified Aliiroseovarius TaxID=2623558 RepID=UPI00352FA15C
MGQISVKTPGQFSTKINTRLSERFGIAHSSLEFENERNAHTNANLYGHGSNGHE